MFETLWKKLLFLLRRNRFDRELEEEMRFHLEMKAQENREAGMSREDARHTALRGFGNPTLLQEVSREMWGLRWLEELFQDLQYGFRMLRRSPGFTATAVLSLALGIGANTAIFTVIDTVLLRMLPVKDPGELVQIMSVSPKDRRPNAAFSYPAFERLRDRQLVRGMFASAGLRLNVTADGQAELARGQLVSGSFFTVLGVQPVIGRTFTADDDRVPGGHPVAVISHGYWKRRFALDPAVVGKGIALNAKPFAIIGVTPPDFFGIQVGDATDFWVPMMMQGEFDVPALNNPGYWWLEVVARLDPAVPREQSQAGLNLAYRHALAEMRDGDPTRARERPEDQRRIELDPAGRGLGTIRRQVSTPLMVVMAVVGLVLLIACANVAGLQLARSVSRRKEIGVRIALGAGRLRLVRQLMTESVLLGLIGGVLGLALAYWGTRVLASLLMSEGLPLVIRFESSTRILAFTSLVSLLTGLLFGLSPALQATKVDVNTTIKDQTHTLAGMSRLRLGKALVVLQVAVSLILIVGAGLLIRTLQNLKGVDVGFHRDNVLVLTVSPALAGYQNSQFAELYRRLLERIDAIPGVRVASIARFSLLTRGLWRTNLMVQGNAPGRDENIATGANLVGPKFFQMMGVPMLMGREFGPEDNEKSAKVAVVSEALARKYFGSANPVGRRIGITRTQTPASLEIVGVVKDTKYNSVREETPPMVYVPYLQSPMPLGDLKLHARTVGDPTALVSAVRREIQAVDRNLAVFDIRTLEQQVDQSLFAERLFVKLSSSFGFLALLLASIGLYGVMSYTVTRRTGEIGVRMALGAGRGSVLRLLLWDTLVLVLVGAALGVPAALAAGRVISSQMYGLTPGDPATISAATVVMAAVALLAGYLPARRASRVDPLMALRHD
jgi:predicted permease